VGFEESASKSARQLAAEEDDNLRVPASTKKPYNETAPPGKIRDEYAIAKKLCCKLATCIEKTKHKNITYE